MNMIHVHIDHDDPTFDQVVAEFLNRGFVISVTLDEPADHHDELRALIVAETQRSMSELTDQGLTVTPNDHGFSVEDDEAWQAYQMERAYARRSQRERDVHAAEVASCPTCLVQAFEACKTPSGKRYTLYAHVGRVQAAQAASVAVPVNLPDWMVK